ncbi:CsbD family protein, partial [Streptomyces goshikiensis]
MSRGEKAKAKTEQAKGKAKEAAGRAVGNESLTAEGRMDQAKGDGSGSGRRGRRGRRPGPSDGVPA